MVDSNLHALFPPDNNRVLIFNNISRFIYNPTDPIPQGGRCPVCVGTSSVGEASVVLGQPDFATTTNPYLTQSGFRNPTMVASDGKILVLADTDNNRVLIWNSIPTTIDQPADLVLGQPNFTTLQEPPPVNSSALRGPQGVWIQGTQLFVADTQNSRVMIWNKIPTSNNQPADLVLGEPNFIDGPARHHERSTAHCQQPVRPGVGDLRRAAPLCDRPWPQPRVDLEFHSDSERASGGCGGGPAEHDQRTRQRCDRPPALRPGPTPTVTRPTPPDARLSFALPRAPTAPAPRSIRRVAASP